MEATVSMNVSEIDQHSIGSVSTVTNVPRASTSTPVLFDVSIVPTSSYVQRETLMQQVRNQLWNPRSDTSNSRLLAVHGVGGTGKSQLALKYALEERYAYQAVAWFDFSSKEAIRSRSLELLQAYGLNDNEVLKHMPVDTNNPLKSLLERLERLEALKRTWCCNMYACGSNDPAILASPSLLNLSTPAPFPELTRSQTAPVSLDITISIFP